MLETVMLTVMTWNNSKRSNDG